MNSQEELEAVDLHQSHADKDGVLDFSKKLLLLDNVAKGKNRPAHHSHAAVCPGLDIKLFAQPGIQLPSWTLA